MGYKKPEKVFVLQFKDMDGLEVKAKGATVGQLANIVELADRARNVSDGVKALSEVIELFRVFGSKLVSWNLETEEGEPVSLEPLEISGQRETPTEACVRVVMDQDLDFALEIVYAWIDALVGTSDPLERSLPSGELSLEESIPMETL